MRIDYVVTYVDPSDENWKGLYSQYAYLNNNTEIENKRRFDTNNLFKYVFRGIDAYAGFINKVHLIVQSESQVPKWLNRNEVEIVFHDEFIPHEFLPVFNASPIECFFQNIKGLSEFFIFGNDDMFITNIINEADFFNDFFPLNTLCEHTYYEGRSTMFTEMCKRVTDIIKSKLSIRVDNTYYLPYHIQAAMSKTINRKVFSLFEPDIYSSISKFRSSTDINQYLFTVYSQLSTGRKYENRGIDFIKWDKVKNISACIDSLLVKRPKLFCLNNNDNDINIMMLQFFEKLFPQKSRFEI